MEILILIFLFLLQIHPGSLKQGGIPLVACCISAAEQASVSEILNMNNKRERDREVKLHIFYMHLRTVDWNCK